MLLIADKIEKIEVRIEIDENEDHHKWSGCPRLITSESEFLFEAVDVLTVIKAVKTSETVEEFVEKVENTWSKERLATPIIRALNNKAVEKVQKDAISVLDCAFTDENKELFDFREDVEDCLYNAFMAYAGEYDGRFDKLAKNKQVKYLVQSALADC
ncbi:hypothetical protein [uncultured Methanobrevibacter sp.]|uniref:hypothetical protein n=1 Tax=uncultured Methanobrevibacter sp. TaxID=253161 RepID=UPI0025EAE7B3|nr:hypothetical protein [uncultured Methanobrevibacter sp.]